MRELKHVFRLGDVAQPMLPQVDERGTVRQAPTYNSRRHAGE